MRGLNSVTLGGNIVRDAELRGTRSGSAVLSFTVAVNSTRKTDTGEYVDEASYVDCSVFGRRAEALADRLVKGTYVALTGRIHQSRWTSRDGKTQSKLEVIASEIHYEARGGGPEEDYLGEEVPF